MAKRSNPLERAYQVLDPYQVLEPRAAAYSPRPEPPLAKLVARLRLDPEPRLYIVSGHIGAGKSTELRGLGSQLGAGHSCITEMVDAELVGDRLDELTFVALLAAAVQSHMQHVDVRTLLARSRQRENSVWKLIPQVSITSGSDRPVAEAMDALRDEITRFRQGGPEPVVILDGLDKLGLADLERLIPWLLSVSLPVKTVITVPLSFLFTPMYARHESQIAETAVVPAIRVKNRDGSPGSEGISWMQGVLARRNVLDLFIPEAANVLAMKTGGILRDFVRVARESMLNAYLAGIDRVSMRHAVDAIEDFAVRLARPVTDADLRLLAAVQRSGRVIGHASFLRMIDSGHIIEYRNGSSWYSAHPLIEPAIRDLNDELSRLEAP